MKKNTLNPKENNKISGENVEKMLIKIKEEEK